MWKHLHVKYPLFLSDFNEAWIFSIDFSKKAHISSLIKIGPVGAEFFHADWHDETNSRFWQFCERA
jgi:hypothetical protein